MLRYIAAGSVFGFAAATFFSTFRVEWCNPWKNSVVESPSVQGPSNDPSFINELIREREEQDKELLRKYGSNDQKKSN